MRARSVVSAACGGQEGVKVGAAKAFVLLAARVTRTERHTERSPSHRHTDWSTYCLHITTHQHAIEPLFIWLAGQSYSNPLYADIIVMQCFLAGGRTTPWL